MRYSAAYKDISPCCQPALSWDISAEYRREFLARRVATIFGGSGFIGRYIVERLAKRGWIMRIAVRRPDQALFLKPLGDIAQIVPIAANIRHERSVAAAIQGVDTVINL